jgi:hypothetical protein
MRLTYSRGLSSILCSKLHLKEAAINRPRLSTAALGSSCVLEYEVEGRGLSVRDGLARSLLSRMDTWSNRDIKGRTDGKGKSSFSFFFF